MSKSPQSFITTDESGREAMIEQNAARFAAMIDPTNSAFGEALGTESEVTNDKWGRVVQTRTRPLREDELPPLPEGATRLYVGEMTETRFAAGGEWTPWLSFAQTFAVMPDGDDD